MSFASVSLKDLSYNRDLKLSAQFALFISNLRGKKTVTAQDAYDALTRLLDRKTRKLMDALVEADSLEEADRLVKKQIGIGGLPSDVQEAFDLFVSALYEYELAQTTAAIKALEERQEKIHKIL